jgi:Na+/H+ antiporter NhaD/arsenite permease-like protein
MNTKLFTILLFLATYVLLIALPKYRAWVAIGSALIFIVSGIMPVADAFGQINWNVLMMLAGTMGTVSFFIESKMPDRMADKLLQKTPNVMWVAVALSLFAGIISAFVDNVATVLMVAPVALAIAERLGISPVPLLVSIAVSSNLQGAATLVGDTTSIMLGGYAGMDFLDFIFMDGRFSIFWAVELGAVATVPVIMFLFRKNRTPVTVTEVAVVKDYVPTVLLVSNVALLIAASFLPNRPALTNGYICMGIFALGLIWSAVSKEDMKTFWNAFREIDYHTLGLLAGLFIVIGALTETGVINDISALFVKLGGSDLFLMYTLVVWGSVLFSAFIDNIPYVATMLPVVQGIANMMGCQPYVLYFGLLVGATLGGNLTPIGASANIAAIGILQKAGYEVKAKDFMRIGVPFTLIAVLCGYLYCWFVWARA